MKTIDTPIQSAATITISRAALRDLLAAITRPQPISFVALTKPEQKANPWGRPIYKLARINAFIGATYVNSVNKQRDKCGAETVLEEREHDWATRVTPCLLAKPDAKSGGEKYYLAAQVQHHDRIRAMYLLPEERVGPHGEKRQVFGMIPKDRVAPFIRADRLASAADGLEKPVVFKNYALENIIALRMGGQRYRIRGAW